MAWGLRVFLLETGHVRFPAPTLDGLQLPVTLAPWSRRVVLLAATLMGMHTRAYTPFKVQLNTEGCSEKLA